MVDAAVAILELAGLCADGQAQKLVAQADAEDRDIAFQKLFQVSDNLNVFRGIPGAVGEHHAVKPAHDLLGRGERRNGDDLAATLLQLALDIVLHAVVVQRDAVLLLTLGGIGAAFLTGYSPHRVFDDISLHRRDGLLVRLEALGVDHAVHHALAAQLAGQTAGVDTRQADDLLLLEVFVQRQAAAPVGGMLRDLAHDKARDPALAGLVILKIDAVVADQRVGHGDDLAVVGGVGQHLLIAGHAGVENDLADALSLVADGIPLEQGAIREQ